MCRRKEEEEEKKKEENAESVERRSRFLYQRTGLG
jgi:hypothetical protein